MSTSSVNKLLENINIPRMAKFSQKFPGEAILNPSSCLFDKLNGYKDLIKPGMKVAITAGSRGIAHISDLIASVAQYVKDFGGEPFIFPAMGSHGGATAEGQKEILKGYGITEEKCGCPIRASMDTKKIGETPEGQSVYIDKYASEADAVIVMNRIKPHTGFTAQYGSGLAKMMCIGMGKQKGADSMHEAGFGVFKDRLPSFGQVILDNINIILGIGIIENAYDETCKIEVVEGNSILKEEPEMLKYAKEHMARILIPETDVLIVNTIGKNYAGAGMDANITGTFATPYASGGIKKQRVVALDLSPESEGNAFGMGMANFISKKLYEKADFNAMYANSLTSTVIQPCYTPMVLDSDKHAIQAAIKTCNKVDKNNIRIVYIKNTNEMGEIWLSEALWKEAQEIDGLSMIKEESFIFDENGNL